MIKSPETHGQLALHYEPGQYLNPDRWGYFSWLSREKGRSKAVQKSYPLRDLPDVVRLINSSTSDHDHWISQAVFKLPNRRKINLAHIGLLFIDLDYYHEPELANYPPEFICDVVLRACESKRVPQPSLVMYSGKGLQVKWFHEPLPALALSRWDAVQKMLVDLFHDLGADPNARDASRVLRLDHTVNMKTGNVCRILHITTNPLSTEPVRYAFSELADQVLPYTQDELAQFRRQRIEERKDKRQLQLDTGKVISVNSFARELTLNSLNWSRACDIRKLLELRGGDMGDGLREPGAFWLSNFYCLRYFRSYATRPLDDWAEIREAFRLFGPHWKADIVREKASSLYSKTKQAAAGKTVTFNGREYSPLYTPKNAFLIDALRITADEQKQMSTIIGDDEYAHRHAKREEKRRRDAGAKPRAEYEGQAKDKAEKARALKEKGLSLRAIAKEMGCSVGSVHGYLKKGVQSPCA